MSKNWEDYLPEVLIEADGCPEQVAINAVRNAAIEFCTMSESWRAELDPLNIAVDEAEYPLDIPSGSQVIILRWGRLIDANGGKSKLTTTDEDMLDASEGRLVWRTLTGTVEWIYMIDESTARIVRIPETAVTNGLIVGVTLAPTRDSYEGPDYLYNKWVEEIAHGAKMRLLNMKTRDWYNAPAAAQCKTAFYRGVNRAKIRASRNSTKGRRQAAMRPIA